MPLIKFPPVLDISHWIEVDNFNAIDPKPWLIITKATEAEDFLDAQYAEYADGIRDAGIRLGAYHFMRPGNEINQADWFCEILLTVGLTGNEVLACDLEVPNISLDEVRAFNNRVQALTGIRPVIYSSELRIEDLYPNDICPAWLKAEWVWVAEYPSNPDATNTIPSWIIPHGLTLANIALWQYTDDGIVTGIPKNNVDLNLINPLYMNHIQLTEPTPNPQPEPEDPIMGQGRVIRLTNIRNSVPGGTYNDIGDLHEGDIVTWDRAPLVNGVIWYHLTNATRNNQPIITLGGLSVAQRQDCWAYGVNIEPMETPTPEPADLPAYFTAHDSSGNELARYNKQ